MTERTRRRERITGTAYQAGRPRRDGSTPAFRQPRPDEADTIARMRNEMESRRTAMTGLTRGTTEHTSLLTQFQAIKEAIRRFQTAVGLQPDEWD